MESLTKIASFNELAPATALVEELQRQGIEAHFHDETNQQQWQLWNLDPRAHLQVRVALHDQAHAEALVLENAGAGGPAASAVRCPDCGSFKVEYPQFSRKTLLGALPAAAAAAGVIERDYYCDVCHFTWPAEPPSPEPERDILNWKK